MKPYSEDFRKRIIAAYLEGDESIRQIAKRFEVSKSFVQKILKQYRETGTVAPKAYRRGKSRKLNSKQINLVAELVKQNDKVTLQQLCDMLESKTGVKISPSTMSKIVRQLK